MIVIVDTKIANRYSIKNAFDYIGCETIVSAAPQDIRNADRLVLPGVGAFGNGMSALRNQRLDQLLSDEVTRKGKPILGVCLGMQLMAERGFEAGCHDGLGWISGEVRRLQPKDTSLKVPHMGFNTIHRKNDSRLFAGLPAQCDFYFVHSYHLECSAAVVSATCDFGNQFTAAIEIGNVFGVQFHPEKSQSAGLTVIRNFSKFT